MKKTLFLLLLPFFILSCTVNEDNTEVRTVNLTVKQSDWVEHVDNNGKNRYYSASFNMPEITSFIYDYGNVQTYIYVNNAQQILPYVRHFEDAVGNLWTRTVDFDYSPGNLIVYVTNSDFIKDLPETMSFRVVILWQK